MRSYGAPYDRMETPFRDAHYGARINMSNHQSAGIKLSYAICPLPSICLPVCPVRFKVMVTRAVIMGDIPSVHSPLSLSFLPSLPSSLQSGRLNLARQSGLAR